MKYVVGIGEALFDCLPDGRKLGGAPANFAYHVSQFGLNGWAISAIGDDELGEEIVETFEKVGLDHILPVVEQPTGTVKVTLDSKGIPQYDICLGVAWDNIPLTGDMLYVARHAEAICFGSLAQRSETSRETIHAFLDEAPEDALRVFDINLRQNWFTAEIIAESLHRANILKINDEELVIIGRMFGYPGLDMENKCWLILGKYNLDMLVLTCGTNGSYVFKPGEMSFQATPKVEVADTVGAGDSFTGSFCAAILAGKPIHEAHKLAVEVSAYVCTQNGAMPTLTPELLAAAK